MTNTNDIIEKLDEALMAMEDGPEVSALIGEAIAMLENMRMEQKREQFIATQEKVIFLRRQAS